MTLNIDFAPQVEAWITSEAQQRGMQPVDLIRRMIEDQIVVVPNPHQSADLAGFAFDREHFYFNASSEQFHSALDELARMNSGLPALPDTAFDRESIYEDRL